MTDLQKALTDLQKLTNLPAELDKLREEIAHFSTAQDRPYNGAKYEFHLEVDEFGFADESWEKIIHLGQALQKPFYDKSERHWQETQGDSPSGIGWYGSTEMPVISIICSEPVYLFENTARIPGRFRVTCPARRGTVMRFLGTGDKVLYDNTPFATQTDAPIGLYVEPSTTLNNGMRVRNFEQTIENLSVIGQNGSMPVYIACNAFNLLISDSNFQAHQGAKIVIKHGPQLFASWYPVGQHESPVYLPDPVFRNLLIEGDHRSKRKACGILASGNNMIFQNLNFYGVLHGIYCHGGLNRAVNGCVLHTGETSNGREWAAKDEFILCLLSYREGQPSDSISGNAGAGATLTMPKRSRIERTAGWHLQGEYTL